MSVRRDHRNGHWLYRKQIRLADGRRVRIFGVPTKIGLPDTKAGAQQAERLHMDRVLKNRRSLADSAIAKGVPDGERLRPDLPGRVAPTKQAVIGRCEGVDAAFSYRAGDWWAAAGSGDVRGDRGSEADAVAQACTCWQGR